MDKSLFWEFVFNLFLAILIFVMLTVVPITYNIEIYMNILIYLAPYLFNEILNSSNIENNKKISWIKALIIFLFIVLIFYCFICIFIFSYPSAKEYIYGTPIHIFYLALPIVFFSLFYNSFNKIEKVQEKNY